MTMSLPVREVLRSPLPFQRGKFSLAVMGLLAAKAGDCRIFDDHGAVDDLGRAIQRHRYEPDGDRGPPEDVIIRIDDPTFLPWLLAEEAPIGDAEYLYFDAAMVRASTRLDPGEVVLHDVCGITLVRDGRLVRAIREPRNAEPGAPSGGRGISAFPDS
ncbi:MAG: hypothetical protein U0800_25845 [Isosphaeraceae bacterium]